MTVFKHIEIPHGITDRHGGVSNHPYESMNTSFFGHDDKRHVFENIKRSLISLEIDATTIVATAQVHSDDIIYIGDDFNFDILRKIDLNGTPLEGYTLYVAPETDGLLTHRTDVVLMTFYADCVPLVFFDVKKKIGGSIHSGWKGTVREIGKKAVKMMLEHGSERSDIYAGIGHCAAVCCYEVDAPVIKAFESVFSDEELVQFVFPKDEGKYMLDLKLANKKMLLSAGILEQHIEISDACTICEAENYHSHRRTGYPRGSMSAFVQIK